MANAWPGKGKVCRPVGWADWAFGVVGGPPAFFSLSSKKERDSFAVRALDKNRNTGAHAVSNTPFRCDPAGASATAGAFFPTGSKGGEKTR